MPSVTSILGDNELRDSDAALQVSSAGTSTPVTNLIHAHLAQKWVSQNLVNYLSTKGLVAYYPCGDAGEELRDVSGNGRHLKIQGGAPSLAAGPFGVSTAWDMDGTADYATSVITSGTGTGTGESTTTSLVDPTMNFTLLGVVVGDIAVNVTDAENNTITSISTTTRANDTLNFAAATTMAGKAYEAQRGGFNLTTAVTLFAWVKRTSADGAFMSKYEGAGERAYALWILSQKLRGSISADGTTGVGAFTLDNLTTTRYAFVAMTFDGSTVKAYADAVLVGSTAQSSSIFDSPVAFRIGYDIIAGYADTNISGAGVCSQALTQAQISYVYEVGRRAIANGNAPSEGVDVEWETPRTVTALGFAGDTIPATASLKARLKLAQNFHHYNLNRRLGADAYGREATFNAGFEASRTCKPGSVDIGKSMQITNLDDLQYGVGTQIDGYVYNNFDPYHGGFSLWFMPFFDGDDDEDHFIFEHYFDSNDYVRLVKDSTNDLLLQSFGLTTLVAADAWVAGTWYRIDGSWNKYTIDGTNHQKVSWNVVNTGVRVDAWTPGGVDSTFQLGARSTDQLDQAEGIIGAFQMHSYNIPYHDLFDDFADNVYTGRASGHPGYPTWTLKTGAASAGTGALVLTESGGALADISTPSTVIHDRRWEFTFTLDGTANTEVVRFWLLNGDQFTGAYDGYCVEITAADTFRLYKVTNAALDGGAIIDGDAQWTADTNTHTVRLERLTDGIWQLWIGEASAGTGTDNDYTSVSHLGFYADADANKDVVTIDSLRAALATDWPQVQKRQTVEDLYNFDGSEHDGVAPVVDEDVCFALKAACGEGGVTGALTFDHTDWHTSNNPNGNLIEDGNQEDNDAAGWGLTGTPATATPEATVVHNDLYSVLLKFLAQNDTAFVEQGINTANDGSSFHGRFWYRGDSDNDLDEIKVKVYINGGATYVDETLLAAEHAEDVWRYFEFNIYIGEADGQTIRVEFYQNTANGADTRIYVDQLECWRNLIRGDMDDYDAGVAEGWNVSGTPTLAEETTIVREGSSQKITNDAGYEGILSDNFTTVAGAWYTVSFWVFVASGDNSSIVADVRGSTAVSSDISINALFPPYGQWRRIQGTFQASQGTSWLRIRCYGTDAVWYVDNVSLDQLDEVDASTETPSTVDDSWTTGDTNLNDALFVDGRNGSGDYLEIAAADLPFSTNDAITIHCRIKPKWTDADPDDQLLIWDTNGVIRLMFNAATTEFDLYPDYTRSPCCAASTSGLSVAFDTGGWLTIRFDRTSAVLTGTDTVELDIAGSLVATATLTYTSQTIGALRFAGNIEIDEIRVVDGVMSDADVAVLHAANAEQSDFDKADRGILDLTVEAITDSTYDPFIQYLSASRNVAAMRIVIADDAVVPNAGDDGSEVELGALFAGDYFEFERMPEVSSVADETHDPSITIETLGQQRYTTERNPVRRIRMTAEQMSNAKKESLSDLLRVIGMRKDFWFDIDPGGLVLSADERMEYGRFAFYTPFAPLIGATWTIELLFSQSVE